MKIRLQSLFVVGERLAAANARQVFSKDRLPAQILDHVLDQVESGHAADGERNVKGRAVDDLRAMPHSPWNEEDLASGEDFDLLFGGRGRPQGSSDETEIPRSCRTSATASIRKSAGQ
jgi:hypothetical protein